MPNPREHISKLMAVNVVKLAERKVLELQAILENESLSTEDKERQLLRYEEKDYIRKRTNIF